jgi:hypothetical protein
MLHLVWGLLNIGLFLFFIVICFRAAKLIREKIGLFASIVFVFGLLSFVGRSGDNNENMEPNSNHIKSWKFETADDIGRNGTFQVDVELARTLVSRYHLGISYGKDQQHQMSVPISAYSSAAGFISGVNWIPKSILVNNAARNKFNYTVYGALEWKLLGMTIYTQLKRYKGVATAS